MMMEARAEKCRPRFAALTPELLRLLELRDRDQAFEAMLQADTIMGALVRHAWAMIEGAHVLAAGGVVAVAQGRGMGWIVFSQHARPRHIAQVSRYARERVAELIAFGTFQRIEATARVDFSGAQNVAARIGLSREGVMRRYVDGVDHVLFARVFDPARDGRPTNPIARGSET